MQHTREVRRAVCRERERGGGTRAGKITRHFNQRQSLVEKGGKDKRAMALRICGDKGNYVVFDDETLL